MKMETIKFVMVGDGSVGKTCILLSYTCNYTTGDYIPTVFDNYAKIIKADNGREIRLELWDTAGQENYDRLRPLAYSNTDVVVLCFDITNPHSFKNIEGKWIAEIKHFCKDSIIVLAGTKYDLRDDPKIIKLLNEKNEKPINYTAALLLAKKIGAYRYVECSALTRFGVADIFDDGLRAVLNKPTKRKKPRKKKCSIM